jgi:glycosyltransferase involved in cell wall biosynthesis
VQKKMFAEAFPQTYGKECLLFLGRVHVKKGNDLLFEAFAEVLRAAAGKPGTDKWHLIIAGPNDHAYGEEMKALAQRLGLASRVTWTGMLTGDLKWGAFYNAEAFVLPSHQENFGIAVAEALACRLPVLISDKVNIWREIADDGAGLVENDDLPGTVSLLTRWLSLPPDERAAMRDRAGRCFAQRFHVDRSAQGLIDVLGGIS